MDTTTTTAPAAPDVSTPEGAAAKIAELTSSKEFGERYRAGEVSALNELRQLERTATLGEVPPLHPTGPLTPEQARVRKSELMTSREWQARYHSGDRAAALELEALQRAETAAPLVQPPSNERLPGVPEAPSSYMFAASIPLGAEEVAQNYQAAAHAFGLSLGEFEAVHREQMRSEQINAGKSADAVEEQLHLDLHQLWGPRYDETIDLINEFAANFERKRPGTLAFLREHGLIFNKTLMVAIAHKAMRARIK